MANLADAVISGGVALATLVIGEAVKSLFSRPRDTAAARKDDHDTWRADFVENYEAAKERIAEARADAQEAKEEAKEAVAEAETARTECRKCFDLLREMKDEIHRFLDELDYQIFPMLALPTSNPEEVRLAARQATQKMRDAL